MANRIFVSVFLLLFFLSGKVHCQVNEGLVAKYTFNDASPADETGRYPARAYNVLYTEDRFGNERSACFLHGNPDSYLNLGNADGLKPKIASISVWVSIEQPVYKGKGVDYNPIIWTRAHVEDMFNEAFLIDYHYNMRKFSANNSLSKDKQIYAYAAKTTYLRKWYHLCITFDNDFLSLYVDGELQGKFKKGFETHYLENDSVLVGIRTGQFNNRYFVGMVDDIQIFNRVLPPSEVMALYKAPNPNKNAIIMRWVLLLLLLLVLGLTLRWFIRYRIEKGVAAEKEKNAVSARLLELETRAIRSQMNPHFIFNALNSLQTFILEDDKRQAVNYLSTFSKLLRDILESGETDFITLEQEMHLLDAYVTIEKIRFRHDFEFNIRSGVQSPAEISIPYMLIQPFVENAIWHGLLPRERKCTLNVTFSPLPDKRLLCEIEDNGVGRHHKNKSKKSSHKKSMSTALIGQRLELMSKIYKVDCHYEIIDKENEKKEALGTIVKVYLPIL